MNVAIAMDSFKGSVASFQAGAAVEAGILSVNSAIKTTVLEVSDGGEGSLQAIKSGMKSFEEVQLNVVDALNKEIDVNYLIIYWEGKKTAVIESASVIGLGMLTPTPETTEKGSSYGLGLLLADAIEKECQRIVVFLGGTATSDGGLGLLWGITGKDMSKKGRNLLLDSTFSMDFPQVEKNNSELEIFIGSDVTNPFSGKNGFAHVFAGQKGATHQQIEKIDAQAQRMAKIIHEKIGISLNDLAGTGAAGGIAGALTILGGKIYSGFDLISKITGLEEKLEGVDLIYTGEGSMDSQSSHGKLPMKICEIAEAHMIPVIALCGKREENLGILGEKLLGVFSIQQKPLSLAEALEKETTIKNLTLTGRETFKLFYYTHK